MYKCHISAEAFITMGGKISYENGFVFEFPGGWKFHSVTSDEVHEGLAMMERHLLEDIYKSKCLLEVRV